MARIRTCGAEILVESSASGSTVDFAVNSGTVTRDTTTFRSGLASVKCAGTAAAAARAAMAGSSAVSTAFVRVFFMVDSLPSSTATIIDSAFGAGSFYRVELTAAGKIRLFNESASTQVGSDSAATITTGVWYRLEFSFPVNGASAPVECRLDGVSVAVTGGSVSGTGVSSGAVRCGWVTAPGLNANMWLDDGAVNDSTGTDQTSWPGDGHIVLLLPVSLNANGGSWTDDAAATTSAALTGAVDNTPPNGIASTTTGGGGHEIRNAAANTSIDFNLTDYATAGIGASDTINVLVPMVNVGAPVSTGGKSGSFGILSNPTIPQRAFTGGSGTATFFWRGTAAGTYPTGWGWEVGTLTYAPTVTLGTSPVARLSITAGTTSRIAMADFLGMYVDYTPAVVAPPASLVVDTRRGSRNNPLLRRMQQLPWNRRPSGILVPDRRILLPQPVI